MDTEFTVKNLSAGALAEARKRYAALYAAAMPHAGGIEPRRIEVATFNLSSTLEEFEAVGLGLETVVIFRDSAGDGHTGKVLLNLPWQLLLEHSHVDTFVLKRTAKIPNGFVSLGELINAFGGIRAYNSDGSAKMKNDKPVYVYPDGRYHIVQAKNGAKPLPSASSKDVVEALPGKSETFKAIYGDGVLLSDTAVVLNTPKGVNPEKPPKSFRKRIDHVRETQCITTSREIYMAPGTNVLLPKCTKHAFLAGPKGAVYLEFSTPSMDEADRFTDPRVIR